MQNNIFILVLTYSKHNKISSEMLEICFGKKLVSQVKIFLMKLIKINIKRIPLKIFIVLARLISLGWYYLTQTFTTFGYLMLV